MNFDIVRGNITKVPQTESLIKSLSDYFNKSKDSGTLYLGYPLSANSESKITIDALLVSKNCGLISFIIPEDRTDYNLIKDEQDNLYYQLDRNFKNYPSLRQGRELAFESLVFTIFPDNNFKTINKSYILVSVDDISKYLKNNEKFTPEIFQRLNESLQRVSNIKPKKVRNNIKNELSMGSKIKKIEKEIANLDQWQKKAAMELPEGPQRIRGLAGSGKTIVLALKAAYLHSQFPDWVIAITFYTRSLSQQIKQLIRQFHFEITGSDPEWDNLHVIHAWGTTSENGIYSIVARSLNVTPLNYTNAKIKYGRINCFKEICNDLVPYLKSNYIPTYDAILIDEAQDMPSSFFKLVYNLTKTPKRITWAYDELQNLSEMAMPPMSEMFGTDEEGNPNIILKNKKNQAQQDIILPICYRNPPWTLSLAHSLGFGLYRQKGLVQMFDDLTLWEDIGYQRIGGTLQSGKNVILKRKKESTPKYFGELLKHEEAIVTKKFTNRIKQYKWVAEQILIDITTNELDPDDILVIFPDTYSSKQEFIEFREYLSRHNIYSFLAGVDADKDIFRIRNYVTCSNIYRAKGNEAPMVYIINTEFCVDGYELIKLRNTLFTALTRTRGWVRICGIGESMDLIIKEIDDCRDKDYKLNFKLPTKKELEKVRRINRERTQEEVKKQSNAQAYVKKLIEGIEKGDLDPELMPEIEALINLYKKSKTTDEDYD